MNLLDSIKKHVCYHRSTYIHFPASVLFILLALWFVRAVTGRASREDVESIVGILLSAFRVVVALKLTTWCFTGNLFKHVDPSQGPLPWYNWFLDYGAKCFVFLTVLHSLPG